MTAQELRESLAFTGEDDENISEGDPLFEYCVKSWLDNRVRENWINENLVEMTSEDSSEPFRMTLEEYQKIY